MSSRGSQAWFFQRVSGALIFFILGTHFFLYHYLMGPANWGYDIIGFGASQMDADVVKYYRLAKLFANPLWKVFDVALISLGCYHGFYGIKAIIDDWVTHGAWRTVANVIVYLCGAILAIWGIIAVISFNPQL